MIVTKQTVQRWIRAGEAREVGMTSGGARWPDWPRYVIVEHVARQLTYHYPATPRDEDRLAGREA